MILALSTAKTARSLRQLCNTCTQTRPSLWAAWARRGRGRCRGYEVSSSDLIKEDSVVYINLFKEISVVYDTFKAK